jgi:nucleotide-binding universal stress UspA family protein
MIERALVALDGSARSERSLAWIPRVAPRAEIALARIVERTDPAALYAGGSGQDRLDEGMRYLERIAGGLKPVPRIVARVGSPAEGILEAAAELRADLIVTTTHGGAALERRLFGRTTEKLLHASETPLLVVPSWEAGAAPERIQRILVPMDGSDVSAAAIPLARWIARETGALAVLAHIVTRTGGDEFSLSGIEHRMKELAARVEPAAILATTVIRPGRVPDDIVSTARREGAQLIVMSAHGHGAVRRMLVGSVASRLIRESPIPVLVARHDALRRFAASNAREA